LWTNQPAGQACQWR